MKIQQNLWKTTNKSSNLSKAQEQNFLQLSQFQLNSVKESTLLIII